MPSALQASQCSLVEATYNRGGIARIRATAFHRRLQRNVMHENASRLVSRESTRDGLDLYLQTKLSGTMRKHFGVTDDDHGSVKRLTGNSQCQVGADTRRFARCQG
jgi:hypothetical protein